jgi:ferrous iron transport protein A
MHGRDRDSYRADSAVTLADLAPGRQAIIVGLARQTAVTRRLQQLGFRTGTHVDVIRRAPLGDPTIYRVRDTELCIRRREARLIEVVEETDQ